MARSAGQRNTTQRQVIFEELRRQQTHPTAAELHEIVRRRLPRISLGTVYRNLELLIVDNGSIDPATLTLFDRLVREENAVRILRRPGPFNYSALNNAAAREAAGEVLLLLNNNP